MKYLLIFLLLVAVALTSCNKPLPDYSNEPFDYTVGRIGDISVAANSDTSIMPEVTVISGNAAINPVTLTYTGMPANVYLSKNGFSLLLNNDFTDSIGAHNAVPGVYPMQAVFSSPSLPSKTFSFNLTITPPVNRVANVCGYFYPSNSCWQNVYVSCTIDSVPGVPNEIMIIDRKSIDYNSYGYLDTSYGQVDCCSNTFTIPQQTVRGFKVSGNGSFNYVQYQFRTGVINRTIITDSSIYECSVTLNQN